MYTFPYTSISFFLQHFFIRLNNVKTRTKVVNKNVSQCYHKVRQFYSKKKLKRLRNTFKRILKSDLMWPLPLRLNIILYKYFKRKCYLRNRCFYIKIWPSITSEVILHEIENLRLHINFRQNWFIIFFCEIKKKLRSKWIKIYFTCETSDIKTFIPSSFIRTAPKMPNIPKKLIS